jgi:hypothetical protein
MRVKLRRPVAFMPGLSSQMDRVEGLHQQRAVQFFFHYINPATRKSAFPG